MLPISLFTYAFALWLGLYLLARDARQPLLRFTGLGLVSYAFALCGGILQAEASTPDQGVAARLLLPFIFLPALFWAAAMVYLSPEHEDMRQRLQPPGDAAFALAAMLIYLLGVAGDVSTVAMGHGSPPGAYLFLAAIVATVLVAALALAVRTYRRSPTRQRTLGLLLVVTLFFALGVGLLLLPLNWLPIDLLVLGIAPDLLLLGATVAFVNAFSEGEALWPDLLRSLSYAGFTAILFGSQVALVMWLATGITFAMLVLLLLTVSSAIFLSTFSSQLSTLLDQLALAGYPAQLRARKRLRSEGEAALRSDQALDPLSLAEAEFSRLTRRAFSHMGNLPRLASSPLTRLPQVEQRLQALDKVDSSLVRAAILRDLLAESTLRLKPHHTEAFGSSDEWRFYNALYFPYVVGLKPYSRRADHHNLADGEQEALAWFRREVPQRTLYNWQTAAAELVARDLRERAGECG